MKLPRLPRKKIARLACSRRGLTSIAEGLLLEAWPLLRPLTAWQRSKRLSDLKLITVIGSYGKTTTTRAVRAVLQLRSNPFAHRNCYSMLAGGLARMRAGDRFGVLEVGINGPGQMQDYADLLEPDVVVATSIGHEHHNSLESLQTTLHEKGAMVRSLGKDGLLILNGDDPRLKEMEAMTDARIVRCGLREWNDIRGCHVELNWPLGLKLEIRFPGGSQNVQSHLIGRHQLPGLLLAFACGLEAGVEPVKIARRLAAVAPETGRLQPIHLPSGAIVIRDEFKSAMETILRAFETVAEVPAERKILFLGDITEPRGTQGNSYRQLGRLAAKLFDRVVVTGNGGPRSRSGFCETRPADDFLDVRKDLSRAIAYFQDELRSGDLLLVKGRSTQKLERIGLALQGHPVKCTLNFCDIKSFRCDQCPLL